MTSNSLDTARVLLLTSSHRASDHRIYDKEGVSLAQAGASVTIVGAGPNGPAPDDHIDFVDVPEAAGRPERFFRQPWRCASQAAHLPADVIHLHDPELLQIVPWLRLKHPGARIIYDVHEDFPRLIGMRSYVPGLCRSFVFHTVNALEKRLAKLVDAIVAVTPRLAGRFGNSICEAVYNFPSRRFYERARSAAKTPAARPYDVVHLGTLSIQRARFLAETAGALRRMRPMTTVLITGVHAPIVPLLQGLVPEGCAIEGKLPYGLVPSRLGEARVGLDVHPFPTPNLEVALPVKVFEYMASGCAVVSSAMPVLEDLLKGSDSLTRNVSLLKGGRPGDYAARICGLLDRMDAGEAVGEQARQVACRDYVWEKEADKLISLYERLLSCRTAN